MKCVVPGHQCPSLLSDPRERPYQFTYLAIHFGKIWKSWVFVFFSHLCLPSCFSPLLKKPRIFLRSSKGEVVLRTHLAGFFEMYEWGSRTLHCGMNHFPLAPVQEWFLETSHPPHPRADAGAKQWLYHDRSRPRGAQHRKWVGTEETPAVK